MQEIDRATTYENIHTTGIIISGRIHACALRFYYQDNELHTILYDPNHYQIEMHFTRSELHLCLVVSQQILGDKIRTVCFSLTEKQMGSELQELAYSEARR